MSEVSVTRVGLRGNSGEPLIRPQDRSDDVGHPGLEPI